ncbi:MAG: hypothetical protein ACOX7I_00635 [Oscillospiraceae bacterium]|jgi:hypothetical protein
MQRLWEFALRLLRQEQAKACPEPAEVSMLLKFAEVPFLPVARKEESGEPVYLEHRDRDEAEYGRIISSLCQKGLITLDYDMPLTNFDYAAYKSYPVRGSMALTERGQAVLDMLEVQGAGA